MLNIERFIAKRVADQIRRNAQEVRRSLLWKKRCSCFRRDQRNLVVTFARNEVPRTVFQRSNTALDFKVVMHTRPYQVT